MQILAKGGNALLQTTRHTIRVDAKGADVSAYLLGATGRVRGDDDMIFYNQPASPDGAIRLDGSVLSIDLQAVDPAIERIAICAVPATGTVAAMGRIGVTVDGHVEFSEDTIGMAEAAVIVTELYRRDGAWKIRAVAQGFNGGLAPLSQHFGIDVAGDTAPAPVIAAVPQPASTPANAPKSTTISLTKVTLEKAGRVDLRKGGGAIRATLAWDGRAGSGKGDLDLYCLYVLADGTCGKVYWKDLGRVDAAPWITLSGDSRGAGEEEVVLHSPEKLRFAMFAAYSAVGNGAGSFKSYRPRMILRDQDGSEVTIPLLNPSNTSYWVAITHISVGDVIQIKHIETYGKGGISFIAAERSPRLHPDGSWDVSKGQVEFKRN